MIVATVILVILALALLIYAWQQPGDSHRRGIEQGWQTMRRVLPLLLLAFIIVGYVNVLSPQDVVTSWLGPQSGWTGLFLAELIGMFLPGGPYVVFPLIAILYRSGAGLGPVITLVTSWATLAFITVTFELPFMGWRFTVVRWGLALIVPLLAGGMAQLLFGG